VVARFRIFKPHVVMLLALRNLKLAALILFATCTHQMSAPALVAHLRDQELLAILKCAVVVALVTGYVAAT
jgi:hypothetical protein